MRIDRQTGKLAMYAILVVLLMQSAFALGVAPSRKIVNFIPGETYDLHVTIINNQHKNFKAVIYPEGELAEYISLGNSLAHVTSDQETVTINYTLTLPDDLPPGPRTGRVIVMEFPEDFGEEKRSVVTANLALASSLQVMVPYPGKYAEGKLMIAEAKKDEPVYFTIHVQNYGKERIGSAHATVEIFGPTWEKIAEVSTDTISIDSQQVGVLAANWLADVGKGSYHAVAKIIYDDRLIKIEQNFNIGGVELDIIDLIIDQFTLGEVAKFDIKVLNTWNKIIKDVYAQMKVTDGSGKVYTDFKTVAIDIEPSEVGTLEGYWYTKDVQVGKYNVRVALNYNDKVTERLFNILVEPNKIDTLQPYTGQFISEKEAELRWVKREGILVLIVVILAGVNIYWMVYFSRKLKKNGGRSK